MPMRICACGCGKEFTARQADINRGWGRFATKSCKAKEQEKRTGQHRKWLTKKTVSTVEVDSCDDDYWLGK